MERPIFRAGEEVLWRSYFAPRDSKPKVPATVLRGNEDTNSSQVYVSFGEDQFWQPKYVHVADLIRATPDRTG